METMVGKGGSITNIKILIVDFCIDSDCIPLFVELALLG
jgi:hypothetical protein